MKTTNLLMAVLLVLGLGACQGDPSADTETTTGPAETPGGRDTFVGTWQVISGSMTTNCDGYSPETNATTANLTWRKGAGIEIIAAGPAGFCPLTANVSGLTASVLPSQACTATDGGYTQFTIQRTAYTFTLSADAPIATEESSGTMQTNEAGTVTANCTFQGTAIYQKAAQ
jgi:hypothetical protein